MEVALNGDDFGLMARHALNPVGPFAGQFDGRLNRFGARVHRQGHFVAAELREFFVKERQLVVAESARGQGHFFGLREHRIENARVNVALVDRRISRQAIEVLVAFDIMHPDAFGAFNDHIERMVVVGAVLLFDFDKLFGIHGFAFSCMVRVLPRAPRSREAGRWKKDLTGFLLTTHQVSKNTRRLQANGPEWPFGHASGYAPAGRWPSAGHRRPRRSVRGCGGPEGSASQSHPYRLR